MVGSAYFSEQSLVSSKSSSMGSLPNDVDRIRDVNSPDTSDGTYTVKLRNAHVPVILHFSYGEQHNASFIPFGVGM